MDDKRGAPWLAILLIALVVLPVLYVLSIGPVVWLVEIDYLANEPIGYVYVPLALLVNDTGPFGEACNEALGWYLEWFVSDEPIATQPTPVTTPPPPAPSMRPAPAPPPM